MTSVFVIERGDYSDRRVIAICKTQEIAEEYCRLESTRYDEADWYEWEVEDKLPIKTISYNHWGTVSGNTKVQNLTSENEHHTEFVGQKPRNITIATTEQGKGPKGGLKPEFYINVMGGSKTHVDKAFYDRVAQAKARLAGIE